MTPQKKNQKKKKKKPQELQRILAVTRQKPGSVPS